jgi:hypothetical protein
VPLNLSLIDISWNGCRYATGENSEGHHLFCGHENDGKSSYCSHHHNVCVRQIIPRAQWLAQKRNAEIANIEEEIVSVIQEIRSAKAVKTETNLAHGKTYSEHAGSSC